MENSAPAAPAAPAATPTEVAPPTPGGTGSTQELTAEERVLLGGSESPKTPPPSNQTPAEKSPPPSKGLDLSQKVTIQTAGGPREVTLAQAIARLQKVESADQYLAKAAEQRREVEKLMAQAKENPATWDREQQTKWAEQLLIQEMQMKTLTPDQKTILQERQQRMALEQQIQQQQSQQQQFQMQQQASQIAQKWNQEMIPAMEAMNLAFDGQVDPYDMNLVIMAQEANLQNGIDAPWDVVAADVNEHVVNSMNSRIKKAGIERALALFDEDSQAILGKALVAKVQKARNGQQNPPPEQPSPLKEKPKSDGNLRNLVDHYVRTSGILKG